MLARMEHLNQQDSKRLRRRRPYVPKNYVSKLGIHHFAHLRACSEGLGIETSAMRYLGVDHAHAAVTAHRQTVDAVRAVARRRKEKTWRLIGIFVPYESKASSTVSVAKIPSLDEWIEEMGYEDFPVSETLVWYAEAFPEQAVPEKDRKLKRRETLRTQQIELIARLERAAAEKPTASDLVSGWFDDSTSSKLISAGFLTLGDLNRAVSVGGKWSKGMPAIGPRKAQRIVSFLGTLLQQEIQPQKKQFVIERSITLLPPPSSSKSDQDLQLALAPSPALPHSMLGAGSDLEAVESWIEARAGSDKTVLVYRREAMRLMLWLSYELGRKTFKQITVEDCHSYMAFLQNIPERYMSKLQAKPGQPGWAPFRSQLSPGSYRQSVVIGYSGRA